MGTLIHIDTDSSYLIVQGYASSHKEKMGKSTKARRKIPRAPTAEALEEKIR